MSKSIGQSENQSDYMDVSFEYAIEKGYIPEYTKSSVISLISLNKKISKIAKFAAKIVVLGGFVFIVSLLVEIKAEEKLEWQTVDTIHIVVPDGQKVEGKALNRSDDQKPFKDVTEEMLSLVKSMQPLFVIFGLTGIIFMGYKFIEGDEDFSYLILRMIGIGLFVGMPFVAVALIDDEKKVVSIAESRGFIDSFDGYKTVDLKQKLVEADFLLKEYGINKQGTDFVTLQMLGKVIQRKDITDDLKNEFSSRFTGSYDGVKDTKHKRIINAIDHRVNGENISEFSKAFEEEAKSDLQQSKYVRSAGIGIMIMFGFIAAGSIALSIKISGRLKRIKNAIGLMSK